MPMVPSFEKEKKKVGFDMFPLLLVVVVVACLRWIQRHLPFPLLTRRAVQANEIPESGASMPSSTHALHHFQP